MPMPVFATEPSFAVTIESSLQVGSPNSLGPEEEIRVEPKCVRGSKTFSSGRCWFHMDGHWHLLPCILSLRIRILHRVSLQFRFKNNCANQFFVQKVPLSCREYDTASFFISAEAGGVLCLPFTEGRQFTLTMPADSMAVDNYRVSCSLYNSDSDCVEDLDKNSELGKHEN